MKPIDTTEAENLIAHYDGVEITKEQDAIIAKIAALVVANRDTFGFIDALRVAMRAAFCAGVVITEQNENESA